MELTAQARDALMILMEKDWFAPNTQRPDVETTDKGGCTVWCESEIYRIAPDGHVHRIPAQHAETVFLD